MPPSVCARPSYGPSTAATAILLAAALASPAAQARNLLQADGPGGTYELIRTAYTTEVPDCGHMVPHITEEMDADLGRPVFVFHSHIALDDDRCGAQDRQRTEIRARAGDIVAQNGETVHYRWKFRLAPGFKAATSFTHIFQIKSDEAAPIMTLTPRADTFGTDGRIGKHGTTDLAKFIGNWVVVDLTVLYANDGRIDLTIRRLSDRQMLLQYSGGADTWDDNASGHDSKFGIYRSLANPGSLRDEQVRFADFCASKQSAADCADGDVPPPPPPPSTPPAADAGAPPDATPPIDPEPGTPVPPAPSPPTPPPTPAGTDAGLSPPVAPTQPPSQPLPPPEPTPAPAPAEGGCACHIGPAPGAGGSALAALSLAAAALTFAHRRRKRRSRPR